jgi:hypothetical protein
MQIIRQSLLLAFAMAPLTSIAPAQDTKCRRDLP